MNMTLRDTSAAIALHDESFTAAPIIKLKSKPDFFKPIWWGEEHEDNYEGRCRLIVETFMRGKLKGRMVSTKSNGRHVYYSKNNNTELWLMKDNPSIKVNVCVARKVQGHFIGNSSSISVLRQAPNKEQRKAGKYGRRVWVGGAQKIQDVLSEAMPMVPFRLFKEVRLDINNFTIIDKGADEMLDLGRKVKGREVQTHFTGALLFKIGVDRRSQAIQNKTAEYFLFDIDRNDLKLKNWNAFLSKLGSPASSIAEAYASLKPQEVRDAERFLGRECERQGEWFFIPVQGDFKRATQTNAWNRGRPAYAEAVLQAKGNRAHYVEQLSEEGYVRGKVSHQASEHKPICLEGWHKPVPNTAVESFKITGSVD